MMTVAQQGGSKNYKISIIIVIKKIIYILDIIIYEYSPKT